MIEKIRKIARFIKKRQRSLWRIPINSLFMFLRFPFAPCQPAYITIEPTSFCNLDCPVCETGNKSLNRKQGVMSLADFKVIVNKIYYYTNTILLYFMGEPFLNPATYEMISYARSKKIYTCICTNGEKLDSRKLIESGINEVSFQISGITQNSHKEYRCGADLTKTINNLKKLVEERNLLKRKDLSIEIGLIIMKHNEHQVEEFKKMASCLGVDRIHLIKPRVRTIEQARVFLPLSEKYWLYSSELYKKGILSGLTRRRSHKGCFWLWNSAVVTWNGDILPCCNDPHGNFVMGNIFKEPFKIIWNNRKYRSFRKAVLVKEMSLELCRTCVE